MESKTPKDDDQPMIIFYLKSNQREELVLMVRNYALLSNVNPSYAGVIKSVMEKLNVAPQGKGSVHLPPDDASRRCSFGQYEVQVISDSLRHSNTLSKTGQEKQILEDLQVLAQKSLIMLKKLRKARAFGIELQDGDL